MESFGKCDCGGNLHPVYYMEEETKEIYGRTHTTGRKKKCVSHLVCDHCLQNVCVNGYFDDTIYT